LRLLNRGRPGSGDCLNSTIVTEWHHIENGKISIVQSVFDGRPFEPMFAGVRAAK